MFLFEKQLPYALINGACWSLNGKKQGRRKAVRSSRGTLIMKILSKWTPDQSWVSSDKIMYSLMEHGVINLFLAQEPEYSQRHMIVVWHRWPKIRADFVFLSLGAKCYVCLKKKNKNSSYLAKISFFSTSETIFFLLYINHCVWLNRPFYA